MTVLVLTTVFGFGSPGLLPTCSLGFWSGLVVRAGQDCFAGKFGAEDAFPAGDHDRGQAVADDVDRGAGHVGEGVNAEDDEDGFGGQVEGGGGGQQHDERGAGDAGDALWR